METAAAISNEFNLNFLKLCRQRNSDGNLFYSPFSISTALMMLYEGTRENTKKQMEKLFNLQQSNQLVHKEFHSLLNSLKQLPGDVILSTSNLLMIEKQFEILPDFSNNLKANYNVDATYHDFRSHPEIARQEINLLIELATMQKIKDMFPPDSIDCDTKLILANAIYFKGMWSLPFDKNNTEKKPFYTLSNEEVMVDMMYRSGDDYKYFYCKELKASFLEIPYLGNELSMIIILPNKKDGLPALEKQISVANINSAVEKMYEKDDIHLSLPRFKLEESLKLNQILQDMGIRDVFTPDADLSGINGEKNLLLSSALHKAFVEVNEEGTEAAAGTAMTFRFLCASSPIYFSVTHPFMFVIRQKSAGVILFTGSIYKL